MPYKDIMIMWGYLAGKCIIMTGALAHTCFLLPDLWVCKPCTSYILNNYRLLNISLIDYVQFVIYRTLGDYIMMGLEAGKKIEYKYLLLAFFDSQQYEALKVDYIFNINK